MSFKSINRKKEYSKKYFQEHKEEHYALHKKWRLKNPEKVLAFSSKSYYKNREFILQQRKLFNVKNKTLVFNFYGNKCTCCGESELSVLQIDHIKNDGYKDLKYGRRLGGTHLYNEIVKRNFPSTYQILCANCNFSKLMGKGTCYHKLNSK